ncbi:FadR/GntR family transcriptional regulator [Micropruina sp.]|uniref:FadR/GntR family transcriptional regulator n=1 Tax=Micropruina sp. TaxID=2737536 RepID=UPI0039E28EA3
MQSGSDRARRSLAFLRQKISSGEWPINSRIPTETELMGLLGVGKTTVREAVRSLASLGMLEPLPGIGTFVRSRMPVSSLLTDYIAEFSTAEILGYRRALEIEAAQQAALHRSPEHLAAMRRALEPPSADQVALGPDPRSAPGQFHFLVLEASGNTLLVGVYAGVVNALRRAINAGTVVHATDAAVRRTDHLAVLQAIETGDPAAAAHAMAHHSDRDLVPSN